MEIEMADIYAKQDCYTQKNAFVDYEELKRTLAQKSFVKLPSYAFDTILIANNLSPNEKLFMILVEAISQINISKEGNKSAINSAQSLATMLGLSRRTIFLMQKRLASKDFIRIERSVTNNQHERNSIFPVIDGSSNGKYIPINFKLLRRVLSEKNLNPLDKLLWLYCYKRAHVQSIIKTSSVFFDTYTDISKNISSSEASIRKSISKLNSLKFLMSERSKTIRRDVQRKDKLLLILSTTLPIDIFSDVKTLPNKKSCTQALNPILAEHKTFACNDHHELKKDHSEAKLRSPLSSKNINKNLNNKIVSVDNCQKKEISFERDSKNEILYNNEEIELFINRLLGFMKKDKDLSIYEKLSVFLDRAEKFEYDALMQIKLNPVKYIKLCQRKEDILVLGEIITKLKFFETFKEKNNSRKPKTINQVLEIKNKETSKGKKYFGSIVEAEGYFGKSRKLEEEISKSINLLSKEQYFKIRGYILKMERKGHISIRLKSAGVERLVKEAVCFASSWKPKKIIACEKERFSFLLAVIGSSIAKGAWKTPANYLLAERVDIEHMQKVHRALTHGLDL